MDSRRKSSLRGTRAVYSQVIPGPPAKCEGFLYTILQGDSLSNIARKFNCPTKKIVDANPQFSAGTRSIFVGQIICVPEIRLWPIIDQRAPRVLFVEFFGPFGETLQVQNGSVLLAPRTFIRVAFSRPVNLVFFFLAPSATKIFLPFHLVGQEIVSPPQRSVRFTWDVPTRLRGTLFIVGCNISLCGPAEKILVQSR